jgi:hypothetical protein
LESAEQMQAASKFSARSVLKWAVRLVGVAVIAIAYIGWKVVTEEYELENAVMGAYRPVVLGFLYYLFWVFTRRIDGSVQEPSERPGDGSGRLPAVDVVQFLLFVCIGIAAGFFAVQFVYVAAVDNGLSVIVAKALSFVAFLAASGVVLKVLTRVARKS